MISEKIKELRKQSKMSQEMLANKLNVSRQAVTKWETGAGIPSLESLMDIAKLFNVSLDYLTGVTHASQERDHIFVSRTEYDIERAKHYEIKFLDVSKLDVSFNSGEKLIVELLSDEIAEIESLYKVNIDDIKGRIDINIKESSKLSKCSSYDSLTIRVSIPSKFVNDIELEGNAQVVELKHIENENFEFSGISDKVYIRNASSHVELNLKASAEVYLTDMVGRLDLNQISIKSVVYMKPTEEFSVRTKGIRNKISLDDNFDNMNDSNTSLTIELNGVNSEVVCKHL